MPYGTVNADVIQSSVASTSIGAGNASIMKNRLINGAMVIFQRGTAATADAQYSVDRWRLVKSNDATESVSQNTDAPAGFKNSLKITSSSSYSVTSTDEFEMIQFIEGFVFDVQPKRPTE
jgi:hypothetical protein